MIKTDVNILSAFSATTHSCKDLQELRSFAQSFSANQLKCKMWLVDQLKSIYSPRNILILGSWYSSILPYMLYDGEQRFTCIDIDPTVKRVSDVFNNNLYVNNPVINITGNARDFINVSDLSIFDTIINTSCEHMPFDMKDIIWDNTPLYVFQSNDYFGVDGHINCKHNLQDFVESTGLTNILYEGQIELAKYNRFMVMGRI